MTTETGIIPDELFARIPELAEEAKEVFADHIQARHELYIQRREKRLSYVPAFLGHGRAGKDTVAEYLRDNYVVDYSGSVSEFVNPLVAHSLGLDEETSFTHRHKNRAFWKEYCNELRRTDPSFLVRMCLAEGDMIVGIRGINELTASVEEGVIDHTWWVENPRVPNDPTLEYDADACDFVIRNAGTLEELYERLDKIATVYGYLHK
jgi:hypothetical protein